MADDTQNKSSNGSPWEEVLEEPAKVEKPKIFGSLEETQSNIPPNVAKFVVPGEVKDGVGKAVPASDIKIVEPRPENALKPSAEKSVPEPVLPQKPENIKPVVSTPAVKPAAVPSEKRSLLSRLWPSRKAKETVTAATDQAVAPKDTAPKTLPSNQSVNNSRPAPATTPVVQPNRGIGQTPTTTPPAVPRTTKQASPTQPGGSSGGSFIPLSNNQKPIKKSTIGSIISNFIKKPKVSIIGLILVLLVGLIYFNESGIFPTGIEKVYGFLRLEMLWGGLPADSQTALYQSFKKMDGVTSFSMDAEMNLTVNKGVDSKIVKPLYSQNKSIIFALDKAILAATDSIYDDYYDSNNSSLYNDSGDPLSESPPASDTATSTDQTINPLSDQSSADDSSVSGQTGGQEEQSVLETISSGDQTMVKEYSVKSNNYFGAESSKSEMEISSESGKKSVLEVTLNQKKLYLKSNNIDFYGSQESWKTLDLGIEKEPLEAIFSAPNYQGVSIFGNRIGSGKVNGVPVYRYQVNIKVGKLLSNLLIEDAMIDSITGEIDIGKKDHLVKYLDLIITPAVNSAVTRIEFKGALAEYNQPKEVTIPSEATAIEGIGVNEAVAITTTPPAITTPSTSGASEGLLARDAQRKSDLKRIETALGSYYLANSKYPSTNNRIIETRTSNNILKQALVSKYLDQLPIDPWTDKYYYGYRSDGASYELTALLGNPTDTDGTMIAGKNLYIIKH